MCKKIKNILLSIVYSIGSSLGALALLALGWIWYSRRYINHNAQTTDAIQGEREEHISNQAGLLSYYVDRSGKGNPLLILHSINAAAGVHEIIPIFTAYRGLRPVYALELPGFGKSDRSARSYNPALYQAAILDFITDVIGKPTDVVALSLTSEFVAHAAIEQPDLVHSCVMISPTGFQMPRSERSEKRKNGGSLQNLIYALLAVPLWSRALFDILASRPSIAFFLQKSFEHAIPIGMVEMAYASAHQPGAHHAPIYFLSGKLFTRNVRQSVYANVKVPVLVLYDRDAFVSFEMLVGTVRENPNWKTVRIKPTKGMPHFDKPGETFYAMDQFWKALE